MNSVYSMSRSCKICGPTSFTDQCQVAMARLSTTREFSTEIEPHLRQIRVGTISEFLWHSDVFVSLDGAEVVFCRMGKFSTEPCLVLTLAFLAGRCAELGRPLQSSRVYLRAECRANCRRVVIVASQLGYEEPPIPTLALRLMPDGGLQEQLDVLLQCWNRTRYPRHVSRDSQGELKLWDATESELRNRREECRRRALLAHGISEPRIIGSEEFVDHVSCSVELIRKTSVRSVLNSVSTIEESSRQNSWRYSPRRRTEPVYLKSDCCAKSHFAVAEYIANEGMFRSLVRDEVNLWWKRRKQQVSKWTAR